MLKTSSAPVYITLLVEITYRNKAVVDRMKSEPQSLEVREAEAGRMGLRRQGSISAGGRADSL